MGLTGDHFVATYKGHTIELIGNEWVKTLKLLIDGEMVASESRILPRNVTLTATFEHDGVPHTIVAKSIIRFPWTDESIEIDGEPLALTRTK